jgi:hypothetical protein
MFQSLNPSQAGEAWPGCRLPARWMPQPTRTATSSYPAALPSAGATGRSYGVIMGGIAEEVGFVGRHGLDDLAADLRSRVARRARTSR